MNAKVKKIFDPVSYKRLFAYIRKYGLKGIGGKFVSGWHEGEELIDREIQKVPDPKRREKALDYLEKIRNGERDFRF